MSKFADLKMTAKPFPGTRITFPVGRTSDGGMIVGDFGETPNILVGGCTGSGKTNFLHSMIRSLIERHSPDELRIVLEDTKGTEFRDYDQVPHLFCPIIREPDRLGRVLAALERETELRLETFSAAGCRDIAAWNAANRKTRMPFVVVISDEVSDDMALFPGTVGPFAVRLATQRGVAGIHLVLSSSRFGSGDVFADAMLAAFGGRMAFHADSVDDLTRFLSEYRAEPSVPGRGVWKDSSGELTSVQTPIVRENDIQRTISETIRRYHRRHFAVGCACRARFGTPEELFRQASKTVLETGQATACSLQRRLGIGDEEARRAMSLLEERGVVGPASGNGPRKILVAPR